jgi:hypothetical protein
MPYSEKYGGTIADSLIPTFENVVREFTTTTMKDILFDDKKISFNFIFRQPEAISYIEEVYKKYIVEYYSGFKKSAIKIIQVLKQGNDRDNNLPSLIINDYQSFFELLRQYYEKDIELYFQRMKTSGFPTYEMENCFEQIWLRATPEDFNNPEQFLQRQVQFINDTTFIKYDNEIMIGSSSYFNGHVVYVSNGIARTCDEMPREFKITIYDKQYHYRTELFDRPHYTLPVLRYGIYEKDGKKICVIASIQNKKDETSKEVSSIFNKARYKVNKDISNEENTFEVEPSHLIALSIFINFLHNEGITEIEVPSMYVLDYQYHQKRNVTLMEEFKNEWPEYKQQKDPERYQKERQRLENMLNKEDLISHLKTEKFIKTFMRLTQHYPNSQIESYAGELDSNMHINIPVVQSENDINGDLLKEIYILVDGIYMEKKNNITR